MFRLGERWTGDDIDEKGRDHEHGDELSAQHHHASNVYR
jgi:hypothetical protein